MGYGFWKYSVDKNFSTPWLCIVCKINLPVMPSESSN